MTGPPSVAPGSRSVARFAPGAVALLAIFVVLLLCTRGFYLGDTMTYAVDIARYDGKPPVGSGNLLWEFGHLFWRPLGWALLELGGPAVGKVASWGPVGQAAFLLIAVSWVCGALAVLMWYSLALAKTSSRRIAFAVAFGFACANSFLTYVHSGTSYVPGLFCVTAAVWVLFRPARRGLVMAAGLLAVAGLLWFPYILSAPGVLLLAVRPPGSKPKPVAAPDAYRAAAGFCVIFLVILALGFSAGAWARGVGSVSQARAWIAESGHGWSQSGRVLRLVTGVPRSFLFMGADGILYKRFLRKDPYSPVTAGALVEASLWKIVAFGVFLLCLLWMLWRSSPGEGLLFAAGAVPTLIFAVLLFEPGSPERYFPVYPFLVLAVASVLRGFPGSRRLPQTYIAGFLGCMIVTNTYFMSRPRIDREDAASIARLAPLRAKLARHSLIALLSNKDDIIQASNRSPFSALNVPMPLNLYDVLEPATLRILTWREQFAHEALAAWSNGGDVWISRRFWSSRPLPAWNWVEGDDTRIVWQEVPAFFTQLDTDAAVGGPDGFSRLTPDALNRSVLLSIARRPQRAMRVTPRLPVDTAVFLACPSAAIGVE